MNLPDRGEAEHYTADSLADSQSGSSFNRPKTVCTLKIQVLSKTKAGLADFSFKGNIYQNLTLGSCSFQTPSSSSFLLHLWCVVNSFPANISFHLFFWVCYIEAGFRLPSIFYECSCCWRINLACSAFSELLLFEISTWTLLSRCESLLDGAQQLGVEMGEVGWILNFMVKGLMGFLAIILKLGYGSALGPLWEENKQLRSHGTRVISEKNCD